ncbi:MAG: hydrogenase formation protein HypD [Bacteroidales bacterium]
MAPVKYMDEYRDATLVKKLVHKINEVSRRKVAFMEICGGHTMAIHKFGIPSLLPSNIRLLSGPGCPVCVTGRGFIDKAIAYSHLDDVIVTTFGDLIRVPGSRSTLEKEKANGADVRMVQSSLEAIQIARDNVNKKVVFLGIGFETTAPGSAVAVIQASKMGLDNFFLLSSHKIMPPAMTALVDEGVQLDGYLAPGHVTTITGTSMYHQIASKYGLGVVVTGFEPIDILQGIYMLVNQVESSQPAVEIQYKRAVTESGNQKARAILDEVFELQDDWWRGLGILPASGMKIREKYRLFSAEAMIPIQPGETLEPRGCICGAVLKGIKSPSDCRLFAKECTPVNPVGSCMVSNEGACQAWYRYNRNT